MIRTPDGERPVEDLRQGDIVLVCAKDGSAATRRIIWAGSASVSIDSARSDDEAGYPVRFRANALAPSVPDRDLFITPEHCVFIEGALVPARMLVNGDSIAYDRSQSRFEIFHFRTEDHEVIWSNNMTTETLLGCGEAAGLQSSVEERLDVTAPVTMDDASFRPENSEASQALAAPLCVAREFVEPIHRRLAERAGKGIAPAETVMDDQDPDLHLMTENGQVIRPLRQIDDMMIFQLPASLDEVRIRSRAARPVNAEGPFVDDRRCLGVLIGGVHLWDSLGMTNLDAHLHDEKLEGWNNVEAVPMRWTEGNARLKLGQRRVDTTAILGISVKATARYGAPPL